MHSSILSKLLQLALMLKGFFLFFIFIMPVHFVNNFVSKSPLRSYVFRFSVFYLVHFFFFLRPN